MYREKRRLGLHTGKGEVEDEEMAKMGDLGEENVAQEY